MSTHTLTLSPASPSQICRAAQKDHACQQNIYLELSELIKATCGVPFLLRRQQELHILCKFAYLSVTTLTGYQTLGEEYCSLLLSSPPSGAPPKFFRTLLFIIIECLAPYFFDRIRNLFSRLAPIDAVISLNVSPAICSLAKVISSNRSLPIVLFYLEGTYYHLSKRIMKMRYLWIHNKSQTLPPSLSTAFTAISFLYLFQIVVRTISLFHSDYNDLLKQLKDSRSHSNSKVLPVTTSPGTTCSLCLDCISSPALAPCGHLFCWDCIHHASSSKGECPCCKLPFYPSRIILIQNLKSF